MSDPLESARRIAVRAAELAADGEQARRLPAPVVHDLAEAGLFRLCVPAAAGGLEAEPALLVEVVEALARGDGAAGWCIAVQATTGLLGGYLPAKDARAIFGAPGAIAGGVFAPRGRAVTTPGGYRVAGRWPFASGCEHSGWLLGGCVVEEPDGELRKLPNGMPDVVLMLAPADHFEIHDTWRVSGLRGTGSHDIELSGAEIPAGHAVSVFSRRPREPGRLYAFPLFGLLALAIAGVSLGIARGALDDIADLARDKVRTGGSRVLAAGAAVQGDAARAEAELRAARALLYRTIDDAWTASGGDAALAVEQRASLRLAATHAAAAGARVAESAYRLGGGSAIYDTSPLQRRFRDANVATQHMLVAPPTWELTGRILLGQPTDVTQL